MASVRRMLMSVAACGVATAAGALGQAPRSDSTVFRGRIVSATDATPLPGTEVSLPSLDRTTTTDSTGAFRFFGLPVGLHAVQVRHVGFGLWRDTVTLAAGRETARVYELTSQTPMLDTVRTYAGKQSYISPKLQAFEERRLSHEGGYFVSDSVFRRNESSTLATIVSSRMPGLTVVYVAHSRRALASTRKQCRGLIFVGGDKCHSGGPPNCYVAVYVDGVLNFNAKMADNGVQPPDMEREFNPANFAGAEYYSGGGSAPIGMHPDDDGCGSLWLWTRER